MFEAASTRAKIECSACKYAVEKVAFKFWVGLEEGAEVLNVVAVEARRPCCENALKM